MLFQESGKGFTGELGALVSVEDIRSALPKRFFKGLDTETGVQGIGKPPGEHIPAVPVDDGYKVQKSLCHRNVGDIHRPHLIWSRYLQTAEQIGIDFMARRRFARPGTPIDSLESHQAHQSPYSFPIDQVALALQARSYLSCPIERCGQILTVYQFHKSQVLLGDSFRLVIQSGAADIQQVALAYY